MVVTLADKLRFIEQVFGPGRLARNAKNVEVRCPHCAPSDPNKRKLAIKVDDDKCHCWVCGFRAHTLAPLIKRFGTSQQLIEYRDRFMPVEARRNINVSSESVKEDVSLPRDFRLLTLASSIDPDVKAAWNYIKLRGLTDSDVWYYRLGVSDDPRWKRRIIVPSFDAQGHVNYFVGRAVDERRKPKYDNPDADKLPIIFNEMNVDWTQRLVLCEGTFDMFKCGENVVPMLGSDLNEQSALFNAIIAHNTPIALALDGDMWLKKMPKIVAKLSEYDVDVIVVDTRSMSDPGKATKEQFKEALAAAKHIVWQDTFLDKLNAASEVKFSVTRYVKH